jgi:hypothetical protein
MPFLRADDPDAPCTAFRGLYVDDRRSIGNKPATDGEARSLRRSSLDRTPGLLVEFDKGCVS